jgi:hypothetical protein
LVAAASNEVVALGELKAAKFNAYASMDENTLSHSTMTSLGGVSANSSSERLDLVTAKATPAARVDVAAAFNALSASDFAVVTLAANFEAAVESIVLQPVSVIRNPRQSRMRLIFDFKFRMRESGIVVLMLLFSIIRTAILCD